MTSAALSNDPIIKFYLRMSESTVYETHMPVFSETSLRLAFKQVLAKYRPLESYDLLLYRQLLLLYYAERYNTAKDLLSIMTCFNEEELVTFLDRHDELMSDWERFTAKNLKNVIYKEAFFETLEEWTRRYIHVHGLVDEELLRKKALEIKTLLFWDGKMIKQWLKSFVDMVGQGIVPKSQKAQIQFTSSTPSLSIVSVFKDIQHKLHPFLIERVQNIVEKGYISDDEPKQKRVKPAGSTMSLDIEIIRPGDAGVNLNETENENKSHGQDADQYSILNTGEEYLIKVEAARDTVDSGEIRFEVTNEDAEEEFIVEDLTDKAETPKQNEDTEEKLQIIDNETALSYLSALQAYAVVYGHYEAIELLDTVDSAFRKN